MKEKNVKLIATSTVDLNREYFDKNDVVFVPNIAIIDDEVVLDDYSADVDLYFNRMQDGLLPTSSQNNEETYYELFKEIAESGNDFVHVDISTGITRSTLNARAALDRVKSEYDVDGYVIDSLSVSSGQGLILDRAVELRDKGLSAAEIAKTVESEIQKCVGAFTIRNLTHLYRGGRVSKTSMLLGNALNICPIISIDKNGKLTPYKKAHGFKSAVKNLLEIAEEKAVGGVDYDGKIFICHSLELDNANLLKEKVQEKFKNIKDVEFFNIHLNIGAHTGGGAIGIFFWGDERL